jgi:hypothetical protein
MKHGIRYAASAAILATAFIAGVALAKDKDKAALDPKMEEMMKKAEIAGTPGAGHKVLEALVGSWTAEVKCWMSPDGPPAINKATAKSSWVMDGRFIQEDFKGEFMGKPFKGVSLMGYDNTKQKFNSVWFDDMHTSMLYSEGNFDGANKVITLEGKMDCPITGQKDMVVKQVIRILNKDQHVFEMYDSSQGPNTKTMEITYTRK